MTHEEKKGYLYNMGHNFFWGIFPIISIIAYQKVHSIYIACFSTVIAFIFFFVLVLKNKELKYFKDKTALKYILLASLLIGVIFYGLIFYGMSKTSAGNASIIMLMEIFFTFIILNISKFEKSNIYQVIGSILMIAGSILVIFPGKIQFNTGDLIILLATIAPPLGNHWVREARKLTSSRFIMMIRSFISATAFFIIGYLIADQPIMSDVLSVFWVILLNGIFVLGLGKIFWIEGIHRIPITVSISMTTISPLITLFFAYFILGDIPTIWQILAIFPMAIGVLVLMRKTNR